MIALAPAADLYAIAHTARVPSATIGSVMITFKKLSPVARTIVIDPASIARARRLAKSRDRGAELALWEGEGGRVAPLRAQLSRY